MLAVFVLPFPYSYSSPFALLFVALTTREKKTLKFCYKVITFKSLQKFSTSLPLFMFFFQKASHQEYVCCLILCSNQFKLAIEINKKY